MADPDRTNLTGSCTVYEYGHAHCGPPHLDPFLDRVAYLPPRLYCLLSAYVQRSTFVPLC